jgi:carbamoyl-phosphate synthase large subunit
MINILFTCVGRRFYLLDFFRSELKDRGLILAADMQESAPAISAADKFFAVPAVYSDGYVDLILDICKKENVSAVISLNDLELPVLAAKEKNFKEQGIQLIVSKESVIDICFDKFKTTKFAASIGVKYPKTFTSLDHALDALDKNELSFPVIVKPRWGSGSIGVELARNREELDLVYKLLQIRLSQTILSEASKEDMAHAILIQEKINGVEYGMDVLNDFAGNPVQVYVKEKLAMRAGETDKSMLRFKPEIEEIGFKIGRALKHIGNLDCDIFEADGEYFLLELNPRFGGGYPFTHLSGGNYVAAILAWLENKPLNDSFFTRTYDQYLSKADVLIKI